MNTTTPDITVIIKLQRKEETKNNSGAASQSQQQSRQRAPMKAESDESSESMESSPTSMNSSQVSSRRNASCCRPQVSVGCQCDLRHVHHSEDNQDEDNAGDEPEVENSNDEAEAENSNEIESEHFEEEEPENSEVEEDEVADYSEEEYAEPDNTEQAEKEDSSASEEDIDAHSSSNTNESMTLEVQETLVDIGLIPEHDIVSRLKAQKADMRRQIESLQATLADHEKIMDQVLTQVHFLGHTNRGNGDGHRLDLLERRLINVFDSRLTAILKRLPAEPTQTNSESFGARAESSSHSTAVENSDQCVAFNEPSCAHVLPRRSSHTGVKKEEVAASAPSNAGSTNPPKMKGQAKASRVETQTSSSTVRTMTQAAICQLPPRTVIKPVRPQMSPVIPRKVKKIGETTNPRKQNEEPEGGNHAPRWGPRRS